MRIISAKSVLIALAVTGFSLVGTAANAAGSEGANETNMKLEVRNNEIVLSAGKAGLLAEPHESENSPKAESDEAPRRFVINASAYTASSDECGKNDGITASGEVVKEDETIACPRQFPFGTKLHIEGFGTYICQDRGGAISGNKFDIYMKTKAKAFAFGRRTLWAEIVE